MSKISVVIAVKNEERILDKCLESIKWADEIVIIDDLSTDKTVDIAKKYTNKIYLNNSNGIFHINKNLGLEKATYEWILCLDADEIVSHELAKEIRNAINSGNVNGYLLNRKNYFLGKWIKGCGWYPDNILRLFKKGYAKWPIDVHDTPSLMQGEKSGHLINQLIHYSYYSIEQYFEKFNHYTTYLAYQEYSRGVRINYKNIILNLIIKPKYWFVRKYLLTNGWKEGFRGLFISFSSALVVFVMYAKVWEMQSKKEKNG